MFKKLNATNTSTTTSAVELQYMAVYNTGTNKHKVPKMALYLPCTSKKKTWKHT